METKQWKDVLHIISGKNQKAVENPNGNYPIYGSGGIIGYADDYLCEGGTTIVGRKGTINKPIFVNEPFWNIDTAFGIAPGKNLNPWYLYYFCLYFNFMPLDKSTGRPSLAKSDLLKIKMPVPSLSKQEQIVKQIEESLSQLDSAVETLKKTKQQLEIYRQAVLKKAFDSVKIKTKVSSFCDVVRGGSPRPAGDKKYYDGSIPFLKVADLTKNKGLFVKKYSYTIKEAGLKKTRMVPANTLLLTNSGATLGVPKICTFETTFNDGIAAFLFNNTNNEYLPYHYYFWESKTIELRAINQGAAQPNLNTSIIGDYAFPHCDYHTQKTIAQKIEKQITICNNIEETVIQALQQAEALRQSILKQAFEGML